MAVKQKLKDQVKRGVRIIAPVAAGGIASAAGGALAMRVLPSSITGKIDTKTKRAALSAAAGIVLGAIAVAIIAKTMGPAKAQAYAPYIFGGALALPLLEVVGPMAVDAIVGGIGKLLPSAGSPFTRNPLMPSAGAFAALGQGLGGRIPDDVMPAAGTWADPRTGLGGRIPAAGWGAAGPFWSPGNPAGTRVPAAGRTVRGVMR